MSLSAVRNLSPTRAAFSSPSRPVRVSRASTGLPVYAAPYDYIETTKSFDIQEELKTRFYSNRIDKYTYKEFEAVTLARQVGEGESPPSSRRGKAILEHLAEIWDFCDNQEAYFSIASGLFRMHERVKSYTSAQSDEAEDQLYELVLKMHSAQKEARIATMHELASAAFP
jgi:hypothetical protein